MPAAVRGPGVVTEAVEDAAAAPTASGPGRPSRRFVWVLLNSKEFLYNH